MSDLEAFFDFLLLVELLSLAVVSSVELPGSSNPSDRGYLWKDGLPVDRLFYGRAGETYYEGLVAL